MNREEINKLTKRQAQTALHGAITLLEQAEKAQATFVKMWPFDKAPSQYRKLSPHGGDEDYLVFIPSELIGDYDNDFDNIAWWEIGMGWMDLPHFDWSNHKVDGGIVRISAH